MDAFDLLGVDPDADEEAVIDAYRERVKEVHPDHGGSAREFQRVKRAYERVLAGTAVPDADVAVDDRGAERGSDEGSGGDATDGTIVEYLNYAVLDDHGWALDDDDLFGKAADADLDPGDYGHLVAGPHESLLEAAEAAGLAWPYACRGGACTNCAVMVVEGEMPTPQSHILTPELLDRGIRLSCLAAPTSGEAKIVYNVKHLPGVDDLRLPPTRFKQAQDD